MLTPTFSTIGETDNQIIAELIRNQLPVVRTDLRLQHSDFKRFARYLSVSIFAPGCSMWKGYVTDRTKTNKGSYINFYFHKKKVALHRLIYVNFIGALANDEFVKFKCVNKGHCCSVHCLEKNRYKKVPSGNCPKKEDEGVPPQSSPQPSLVADEKLNVFFV